MPSDTQFYLVKLQAFRIGDSDAAPLFTVEAGPSEERTAGGEIKKEFAEKDKRRYGGGGGHVFIIHCSADTMAIRGQEN